VEGWEGGEAVGGEDLLGKVAGVAGKGSGGAEVEEGLVAVPLFAFLGGEVGGEGAEGLPEGGECGGGEGALTEGSKGGSHGRGEVVAGGAGGESAVGNLAGFVEGAGAAGF
jgi:hypothetical protein